MSSPDEPDRTTDAANPVLGQDAAAKPHGRRNIWIWISAAVTLVAAGFLIWALMLRSDLDSSKQDNAQLQSQIDQAAKSGSAAVDEAKTLYNDVAQELGSTSEALATSQQDLEKAKKIGAGAVAAVAAAAAAAVKASKDSDQADKKAAEADKNAADATKQAEQATSDAEKAKAEADKAKAETEKANAEAEKAKAEADKAKADGDKATAEADLVKSKAAIVADCAKAYVSAFGALFEGESAKDQAPAVRESLKPITADCKAALSGT